MKIAWHNNKLSIVPLIFSALMVFILEMTHDLAYKAAINASTILSKQFIVHNFVESIWAKYSNHNLLIEPESELHNKSNVDMFSHGTVNTSEEEDIYKEIHSFFESYDIVFMSLYKLSGETIVNEGNNDRAAFAQSLAMADLKMKPSAPSMVWSNPVGNALFVTNAVFLYDDGTYSIQDEKENTKPIAILSMTYDYSKFSNILKVSYNSLCGCLILVFATITAIFVFDRKQAQKDALKPLIEQQRKSFIIENSMLEIKHDAEVKSRFFANFSHELRTPLNSIIGFSETMEKDDTLQVKYRKYAKYINQSGQHLLEVINDIIDYFCLDASSLEINITKFDVAKVTKLCVGIIKGQAAQKNITIEENYESAAVMADYKRLRQVLLNLLSNAVKFTNQNGRISIAVNASAENKTVVSIKDNGIGIDTANMALIFTPFGRMASNKAQGAGLGLPLSRELIRAMGGELRLTSTLDKGTTVELIFECATQKSMLP